MKRSLDVAAIVLTALLLLAFAALSLRGLIAPEQASARFGAPVADAAGSLFYRVYLSRNLVIVITGAIFLLTRQWTPLAILLTVTAALPVFDMTVLSSNGVTPPVFHPLALALIAITAEHALCSTINRRLVTLTSHVRRRTGSSTGAVAASTESLVSRAISVPSYSCTESLSSNRATLPPAPRSFR